MSEKIEIRDIRLLEPMDKPKRQPYTVGDTVSLSEWDKTQPHDESLGRCEVVGVRAEDDCRTGWMVKLRPVLKPSMVIELDSGWID